MRYLAIGANICGTNYLAWENYIFWALLLGGRFLLLLSKGRLCSLPKNVHEKSLISVTNSFPMFDAVKKDAIFSYIQTLMSNNWVEQHISLTNFRLIP